MTTKPVPPDATVLTLTAGLTVACPTCGSPIEVPLEVLPVYRVDESGPGIASLGLWAQRLQVSHTCTTAEEDQGVLGQPLR